jgi:hypothetical protein
VTEREGMDACFFPIFVTGHVRIALRHQRGEGRHYSVSVRFIIRKVQYKVPTWKKEELCLSVRLT